MDKKDMNDFKQIRERFLADTRQHFFASDTTDSMARPNSDPCRASTNEPHFRQTGI